MKKTGLGVLGEQFASTYLEEQGYRIRERNFLSRFGEIDIVAEKESFLCFVEVKTRSPGALAAPRESVTLQKQQKLRKTAEYYIARHSYEIQRRGLQPRFDCAEVFVDREQRLMSVNYIKNAFY